MQFNPMALAFWLICACIGYLCYGDLYHTIVGLFIGLVISFVAGAVILINSK